MPRDFFRSAARQRLTGESGDFADEPEVTPEVIGARIRRLREQQGLTVRDLAEKAGIDKNTVVRTEQGKPVSLTTLRRICAALSTTLVRLLVGETEEGAIFSHRLGPGSGFWIRHSQVEAALNLEEAEKFRDETARQRAAAAGEAAFNNLMSSQIPNGRLRPSILELYGETIRRTHPGEEWVMCLKGELLLTVAGQSALLHEGESAAFWPTEVHTYAPSPEAVRTGALPILVLSVRLNSVPDHQRPPSPAEPADSSPAGG